MGTRQVVDPVIGELLVFWRRKLPPTPEERKKLSRLAVILLRQWDRLVETDGVLYRRVFRSDGGEEIFQVLLPAVMKHDVLTQLHQQHGHQGVERTFQLVRQRCYWPGMSADIARWCQECERCQCAKGVPSAPGSFMGHLLAARPNEILALDFTVLEPSRSGLENVLVMTDIFTKYTLAVPTRDQRAETVAQVLVVEWFCRLGVPGRIHSDQGRNFESERVQEPLAGSDHRWILEQQDRLQVAFVGARERLGAAANRRKARHDLQVREAPLKEGQLVYLRDYSVRGRCKIQDLWSSVAYQVMRAPKEGGAVYTIASTTDLGKVKHVHRSLLKAQICQNLPTGLSNSPGA